ILKADPGFVEGRLWGDGMIRIVGREFSGLIESPCYQRGELSCLSCHQLHGAPADDQLAPNMRGDRACTSCHQTYVDKKSAARHSHHTPGSTGSRCYNCHMPHTTYGLLGASRSHEISVPEVDGSIQGVRPNACNLCHLDKTLDWASRYLQRWYGIDAPIVEKEAKGIAAGFAWALAGDASQRALAAWHMGWTPALAASGKSWVAPVLALLLEDPYDAVRYIAGRSLARLPGYEDLDYDYVGTPTQRTAIAREVERRWQALSEHRRDAELLRDPEGNLRTLAIAELLEGRDRRPIDLRE
ncbi:MAG TPA: C cytochrome precursor, partial [Nannocystis exedens]|nr:C cytochrome precursor [Nannocystis exedens]